METQPHNQDEPAAVESPRIHETPVGLWVSVWDGRNRYIASDGSTHDMCGSDCWHTTREEAESAVAKYRSLQSPRPTISPLEAIPGRWYESVEWGRVLCCGRSSHHWPTAFAVRLVGGCTDMRYLSPCDQLTEAEVQSWE